MSTAYCCVLIYLPHLQLDREPRPFPRLAFKRQVTDINDFKYEDFDLQGYDPHPRIAMDMAV